VGKFDLDDLFKDFDPESTDPVDVATDEATTPSEANGPTPFVRNDPAETPRPPDLSESGLGKELPTQLALREADPTRICPQDALSRIYDPSSEGADGQPNAITDLARHLLARNVVTNEQLASAERMLKQSPGSKLAQVLIDMGIDEEQVQNAVAHTSKLPFERVDSTADDSYDRRSLNRLTPEYCKINLLLPLRTEGSRLVVGTTNPEDVFLLDDVKRRLNVASIKHVLITAYDVRGVIEMLTEAESDGYDVEALLAEADVDEDDVELVDDIDRDADVEGADSSPVVRYVNHIIQTALREGASDIHIEPDEKTLKVRFRIDGILFEMMNPPRKMHAALTSRIKIMANLDIAERRLPQDGRVRATAFGRKLDLRVSTIPTPKGEKTVMRILDNRSISVSLDELGFFPQTLELWKQQVAEPHGIILVTGPTGSGKTTTLYSSIRQMDLRKLNVSTVEDPVEYDLENITQIQTHEKIGMTFATALRSLLRQDPDVIMLGEIRDLETASTAIQAAMTGHLVLSTLHTNDAPSSITRLINIGIEPFLVGAAVNTVLAQRLVRRICDNCKQDAPLQAEYREYLETHEITDINIKSGSGCNKCRETGYAGRNGIYELLQMTDLTRDAVARNPNVTEFRNACIDEGMMPLRKYGFLKAAEGVTTVEEVLRVTESH
jgi:type IV pilus assembly protein PilB